ncbi:TetR family transcriptional regulator [Massilia phosphatilytica]|uniref:TetR/AcrR family transcriptional regulator n=1 Tax=Massilia orientalis TaxID=3050128 RepID=A0ACC7MJJ6_9BURK|nr:TetR family transcriptional regulator [Massilia sp. YIM B02787]PQO96563.1 TetR family transcriptional regulator [Massilia phosphatilytica]
MRKSRAEASRTKENIIDAAAATFRQDGIAATTLIELMAAAGLTRGGFYKHFASKEEVLAQAITHAIDGVAATIGTAVRQRRNGTPLQRVLDAYLTTQHRDHPERGCLFAAIGPELAREGEAVRAAAAEGLERMLDVFQQDMTRADAVVALSASVGALMLARLAPDATASKTILQQVRAHLLDHLPSDHVDA